jgi:hypothetical protein
MYIGKGSGERIDYHIYEALCVGKRSGKKSWSTKKVHIIRKINDFGLEPIRYKLYENITEYTAFRLERFFIKLIGRSDNKLGPLCNLTDGGEGSSGSKWTDERKNYMSKLMSNQKPNYGNLGNKYTQETKDKIGNSNRGKRRTEEQKLLISNNTRLSMKNRIEVNVLDLEGNLVKNFPSIRSFLLEKNRYDKKLHVFEKIKAIS